jgi:hypothetical protein
MRDPRYQSLNKPKRQNGLQRVIATLGAFILILAGTNLSESATSKVTHSSSYIISDFIAVDLRTGAEWMRCSVGQIFENNTCTGEAMRLSQEETRQAIKLANKELGGLWRLPTLKELESLVCQECPVPKIDKVVFPNTLAEPYWTGEKNWITSQNIWSVNFMTGFSYGRFFTYQSLAVRLVKGL